MKRKEFRELIKECIVELVLEDEGTITEMTVRFDKNQLAKEMEPLLRKQLNGKPWPAFEDFQKILNNRMILTRLQQYPIRQAAIIATDMLLKLSK